MHFLISFLRFLHSIFVRRGEQQANDKNIVVLWKPEKISAEIRADNVNLKIGKYLYLEQELDPGEHGWKMSKMEIPDSWMVLHVSLQGEQLVLEVKDHGKYQVNAFNKGPLSYAILCAGKKNDQRLEAIWNEHAKMLVD